MSPTTTPGKYEDRRAHTLRARYLRTFGGVGVPVPVDAIAEELLGLRIEQSWEIDCSGMLLPTERTIVLSAAEAPRDEAPLRRFRFTIAHEIGHWVCHCLEGRAPDTEPTYCRPVDLTEAADRDLEREANIFAAELLMPEAEVRSVWEAVGSSGAVTSTLEDAVREAAAAFDVSLSAMWYRLYSFALVPSKPDGNAPDADAYRRERPQDPHR